MGSESLAAVFQRPGPAHFCLVYTSAQERCDVVAPFIQSGLSRGEKCIYLFDDSSDQELPRALERRGVDVVTHTAAGALRCTPARAAYLTDNRFNPVRMIACLRRSCATARQEGFTSLCCSGEMTWALGNPSAEAHLAEYESRLTGLFSQIPWRAVCQYDARRFPPELLRDVVARHPLVIYNSTVYENSSGREVMVSGGAVQGTVFTIPLPEAAPRVRRILVVDDEQFIVVLLKRMLERLGYHVTAMTGSREALEAFSADPDGYDLIISDLAMPELTGDRLAAAALVIRPDVPIVIASGNAPARGEQGLARIGIRAFMPKPFFSVEVARVVSSILGSPQARPGSQQGSDH